MTKKTKTRSAYKLVIGWCPECAKAKAVLAGHTHCVWVPEEYRSAAFDRARVQDTMEPIPAIGPTERLPARELWTAIVVVSIELSVLREMLRAFVEVGNADDARIVEEAIAGDEDAILWSLKRAKM